MAVDDDHSDEERPAEERLESREPSVEDLVELCRDLNELAAEYVIIGGFAMRAAGFDRRTMDIDVLIATGSENERRVIEALSRLPDGAAAELSPGELEEFVVVRVADEIVVDLMVSASGVDYRAASAHIVRHDVDGVSIPFASPRLLWQMKRDSLRDKDRPDARFLRMLLEHAGQDIDR